jgi:diguanylate cyclase (GGDEF)-like protein
VAKVLPEERLRGFLERKRRGSQVVAVPPVGAWLAHTLELARRLVPCEAGSLLLDDPAQKRPGSTLAFIAAFGPTAEEVVGLEVPEGQGIVGEVYRTGLTLRIDRPAEDPRFYARVDHIGSFRTHSLMAVPVRLEQAVCGVFELVNRRGPTGFSERDEELAELLAEHVSRALLNAVDILKQNHLALHDDLTSMRNVRGLDEHLEAEVARAREAGTDLAVVFVDVDRLKLINDEHGHVMGSATLRQVAWALRDALGDRGVGFRFGGDEFVLVCPGLDAAHAKVLTEELRRAVRDATGEAKGTPPVTTSLGIATLHASLRRDATAAPVGVRLLRAADAALYRAKEHGRDRVMQASPVDDTLKHVLGSKRA